MSNKSNLSTSELVFEEFLIKYYTNILKEINKKNEREFKKEIVEKLLQNNIFLLKRIQDPGFYWYLCKQILNNENFLKLTTQYIKREIALKLMKSKFFFDPFSKITEWEEFNIPVFAPLNPMEKDDHKIKQFNEKLIFYLEKELKNAKIEGNLEKVRVFEAVMKDYKNFTYNIRELLIDPFSDKPFTLNFIKHYETILRNQNLRLSELYNLSPIFLRSSTEFFLFQNPENEELILYIANIISDQLGIPIEKAILLNKFIKDIISVIHFKWFDLKEKLEKWKILNDDYSYELSQKDFKAIYETYKVKLKTRIKDEKIREYIEQMYDELKQSLPKKSKKNEYEDKLVKNLNQQIDFEEFIIINLIQSLFQRGYFENSINGLKFLIQEAKTVESKFFCYNNLGDLYRKLGNYEEAIENFKKSIEILQNNYIYNKAVVYKNIARCYHNLQDENQEVYFFKEAEEILTQLNGIDKYRLYFNLIYAYEDIGNYKNSYDLILKIATLNLTYDEISENAYEKLEFYNKYRNVDFSLNEKKLSEYFLKTKIEEFRTYFKIQKREFQFDEAELSLIRALNIAKKSGDIVSINLIIEELAEFYILTKNQKKFIELFSELPSKIIIPKILIFQAVYLILINDYEGGFSLFSKIYQNYFKIDPKEFLFQLSPIYKKGSLLHDELPPILWFLKPFLDFKYPDVDKLVLRIIECMNTNEDKGELLKDIGIIYDQSRSLEDCLKIYKMAKRFFDDDLNSEIIGKINIAGAYVTMDEFEIADKCINIILEKFENDNTRILIKPRVAEIVLRNMTLFYEFKYDFPNAIKIIEKAKKYSNNPELDFLLEKYLKMNEKFLFYNAIDDKEVKNLLFSSDLIFDKLSEASFEIDYSLIIIGYCKAIELLLDKKLIKKMDLSNIRKSYYEDTNSKKNRKKVPEVLKSILNKKDQKSIGIGQWRYVIKDLIEKDTFKNSKPIYYEFLNKLDKLIDEGKRNIIKNSCENLFEYRNQSAHIKFHSKEEFLEDRPVLVSNINNILSIFQ